MELYLLIAFLLLVSLLALQGLLFRQWRSAFRERHEQVLLLCQEVVRLQSEIQRLKAKETEMVRVRLQELG
jgi:Tfp pilus assembly protein PilN